MLVVGFGALCFRRTITVYRCTKYNEERDRPDTGVFFHLVFFFFQELIAIQSLKLAANNIYTLKVSEYYVFNPFITFPIYQ